MLQFPPERLDRPHYISYKISYNEIFSSASPLSRSRFRTAPARGNETSGAD
jgi:hypothetical protein